MPSSPNPLSAAASSCNVATTTSLVSSVSAVRMSAGQLINANHPKDCLCSYRSNLRFIPEQRLFPQRHLLLQSPINYAGFVERHSLSEEEFKFCSGKRCSIANDTFKITYGKCLLFPLFSQIYWNRKILDIFLNNSLS